MNVQKPKYLILLFLCVLSIACNTEHISESNNENPKNQDSITNDRIKEFFKILQIKLYLDDHNKHISKGFTMPVEESKFLRTYQYCDEITRLDYSELKIDILNNFRFFSQSNLSVYNKYGSETIIAMDTNSVFYVIKGVENTAFNYILNSEYSELDMNLALKIADTHFDLLYIDSKTKELDEKELLDFGINPKKVIKNSNEIFIEKYFLAPLVFKIFKVKYVINKDFPSLKHQRFFVRKLD